MMQPVCILAPHQEQEVQHEQQQKLWGRSEPDQLLPAGENKPDLIRVKNNEI